MLRVHVGELDLGCQFSVPPPPLQYKPCLQEFYADYAPEKLGQLDDTLAKFEGREKQLFAKLSKKYGKKANIARCTASKS